MARARPNSLRCPAVERAGPEAGARALLWSSGATRQLAPTLNQKIGARVGTLLGQTDAIAQRQAATVAPVQKLVGLHLTSGVPSGIAIVGLPFTASAWGSTSASTCPQAVP